MTITTATSMRPTTAWPDGAHSSARTVADFASVHADAAARPPEVARAAAAFRTDVGSLGPDDAARAARLVNDAVDPLYPYVVINRQPAEAIRILEAGGRLPNVFDIPDDSPVRPYRKTPAQAKVDREGGERILGIHGEGPRERTTVYGMLGLFDAPVGTGALPARTGAGPYGDVSFILRQSVLPRAFLLPLDHGGSADEPGGIEHVRGVALERLLYSHAVLHTRFGPGNFNTREDAPPEQLRQRFRDVLDRPDDEALAVVRDELVARPGPDDRYVYMEADIGAPTVDDIAAIHIERNGRRLDPAVEEHLRSVAEQRRIPILD